MTIGVNFGALDATAQKVTATTAALNAQLDELRRNLAPVVGTWTGQAAEQYQDAQRKWDQSAADLNAVLGQIGKALASANENYAATERSNAARF